MSPRYFGMSIPSSDFIFEKKQGKFCLSFCIYRNLKQFDVNIMYSSNLVHIHNLRSNYGEAVRRVITALSPEFPYSARLRPFNKI